MNSQRHLLAIRDSFIITMPLVMAASIMVLLNALIFSNATVQQFIDLSPLADLAVIVNNGTMSILSVVVCYNIGWNLANHYIRSGEMDDPAFSAVHAGVLSVALLFILMPVKSMVTLTDGSTAEATGVFMQSLTSSSGLATAMLASLLGTELFMKLAKIKRIKIKMPDGVPPAVATSFNSLIPETVVILIFAIFVFALNRLAGLDFPSLIELIIQTPLKSICFICSRHLILTVFL